MIKDQYTQQNHSGNCIRQINRSGFKLIELVIVVAILAILAAFLLPNMRRSGEAARRSTCKNNFKQINIALHNYADDQGALPPAYTVDANGKPLHSWRTLILPYLDEKPLYESIDLSKPWNDPINSEAYAKTLHVYACPSANLPVGHTTSLALVGPECGFRPTKPRRFEEFQDGISNTVWVVDVSAAEAVHWMNPGDSANQFFLNFNDQSELSHSGGIQVALADGTVRFLTTNLPMATRRALSTIAGGEEVGQF